MFWLIDDFLTNITSKKKFFITTVCILGFLIYMNTFTAPFVFDDYSNIYANNAYRNLNLLTAWWSPLKPRFIGYFTFFLNYQIGGWNTSIYHLTNLAIHIATTLMVWRLLLLIFETPKIKGLEISKQKTTIAAFCALIFLTHPIQTQAVTYIVQRFESLAAFFYIVSLYFYLKARLAKKLYYLIPTAASMALGFLTKETAFTLPAMFLVFEFFLIGNFKRFLNPKILTILFVFFGVCLRAFFSLTSLSDALGAKITLSGETVNSKNYLITQLAVFLKYIKLVIIPIGQSVDHLQPVISSIANPFVLTGLLLVTLLVTVAIFTFKKSPLISFSIAWTFLTMSIASSFLPLGDLMMEYRLYLPMVGISLFLVTSLWHIRKSLPVKWTYLLLVLVFAYGILTFARNNVWLTRSGVWKDVVSQNPKNTRALTNLASAYFTEKNYGNARKYVDKSLELFPNNPDALVIKGAIAAQKEQYTEAVEYIQAALALDSEHIGAYYNLAVVSYKQKQYNKSAEAFKNILRIGPNKDNVILLEMLSYVLSLDGKTEEAQFYKQQAISLDPSSEKDFKRIESSVKNKMGQDITPEIQN